MLKFEVCLDSNFTLEGIPKEDFLYEVIEAHDKEEAKRIARDKWGNDVVWVLELIGW